MITVKQLISLAPFSEEIKKELLEKADTFSPDKKFEIEETCWNLISADYQNKLKFAVQKATLEMAKGEKTYSQEYFKKIEESLFMELVSKLNAADDEEKINEIKKQLESVAHKQSSQ